MQQGGRHLLKIWEFSRFSHTGFQASEIDCKFDKFAGLMKSN